MLYKLYCILKTFIIYVTMPIRLFLIYLIFLIGVYLLHFLKKEGDITFCVLAMGKIMLFILSMHIKTIYNIYGYRTIKKYVGMG